MAGRIDELRKRLEAQPASRLFAQLAEELRKDGQLDEAIRVCREGLTQHPAYSSAHMTLGRALFDKGELEAARLELEQVVAAAPDNILAGRLLGEALEGLGELAEARKRYETTLLLSPDDAQLKAHLEALPSPGARREATGRFTVPPEGMRRAAAQSVVAAAVATAKETPSGGARSGDASEPPAEPAPEAAKSSPAAATEASAGAAAPEVEAAPREEAAAADGARGTSGVEVGGAAAAPEQRLRRGDTTPGTIRFTRPEPTEEDGEPGKSTGRTLPFGTPAPRLPQRPPRRVPGSGLRPRRPETRPVSVESVKRALEAAEQQTAAPPRSPDGELATATLAELYLKQGHPKKAEEVYQAILAREPGNQEIRARLAEIESRVGGGSPRRQALQRGIERLEGLLRAVQQARRA